MNLNVLGAPTGEPLLDPGLGAPRQRHGFPLTSDPQLSPVREWGTFRLLHLPCKQLSHWWAGATPEPVLGVEGPGGLPGDKDAAYL